MEDSGVLRFDLVRIHLFLHHIHIYSILIIFTYIQTRIKTYLHTLTSHIHLYIYIIYLYVWMNVCMYVCMYETRMTSTTRTKTTVYVCGSPYSWWSPRTSSCTSSDGKIYTACRGSPLTYR